LKGSIRVYVRVKPKILKENEDENVHGFLKVINEEIKCY